MSGNTLLNTPTSNLNTPSTQGYWDQYPWGIEAIL